MIKRLKMLVTSVAAMALTLVPLAAPVTVHAQDPLNSQITQNLCSGVNLDVTDTNCRTEEGTATINNIIKQVINIFSLVVGVVAVVMIIVGGLKYITSGGDASSVSSAKNTILYAIIGLVIVALAQFIVRFVFGRLQQGA